MKKRLADHKHHFSNQISAENFHSRKAGLVYQTFDDFYDDFSTADINWNLIFRWDVKRRETGSCFCELHMLQQRKGAYTPILIEELREKDEIELLDFLQAHWDYLQDIWAPLSR